MATRAEWPDFWRRWERGEWEPELRDLIHDLLEPGDLFVDVGAWIGPVSTWALDVGAQVVAIEPDPVAAAEFRRRLPGVELWPCAVTPQPGVYPFRRKAQGEWGDSESRIVGDEALAERFVVGVRLPDLLGHRIPKLVKVDVEGYECALCPTLAPWLAAHGVAMWVSCHGRAPDRENFERFREVRWAKHRRGDILALP